MSAIAITMSADELADQLATERALFAKLTAEWNAANDALGVIADRLKRCGQTVERLERQQMPDPIPGYNLEGGAR